MTTDSLVQTGRHGSPRPGERGSGWGDGQRDGFPRQVTGRGLEPTEPSPVCTGVSGGGRAQGALWGQSPATTALGSLSSAVPPGAPTLLLGAQKGWWV